MLEKFFQQSKNFLRNMFHRKPILPEPPRSQVYEMESQPAEYEPDKIRPTKAYADQRQKMPRNRRRKPSKTMKHLYHLS